MKKVLFVLAFVAVYGVSMAMTSNTQVVSLDQTVTVVADVDTNIDTPEVEKEKTEGCAGEKSAAKSGCGSSCVGKK